MKTKRLIFLAFLLLPSLVHAWPNTPPPISPFGVVPEGTLRLFVKEHAISLFSEIEARNDLSGAQYRAITFGPYYRPIPNLRVGVFYRRQWGVLHDYDWQFGTTQWGWLPVNSRGEDNLILDATPRIQLDFLPVKNLVFETKARWIHNFFNSQETFIVRPGLTYFWMKDSEPLMEFFLQEELYFPLNYGLSSIYETWTYLGTLYNLNSTFQIGFNVAYHTANWGSTPDFTTTVVPSGGYNVQQACLVIGFLGVIRFDLSGN